MNIEPIEQLIVNAMAFFSFGFILGSAIIPAIKEYFHKRRDEAKKES